MELSEFAGASNLVALFLKRADQLGDKPFLAAKHEGAWRTMSWREAAGQVCVLAENPDIRETMREVTRALKRMRLGRLYMALTIARVRGGTVTLSAAGMPAALLYRASTGEVEEIVLKGMPLGAFADFKYEEREVTL